MNNYLNPDSPDAFVDFPHKNPSEYLPHECAKCKGYGGWNLRINAYPLHGKEDTPENRHIFAHFRASCDNCNGYGYIAENTDHIHTWVRIKNIGKCLNLYTCSGCGQNKEVDSSD